MSTLALAPPTWRATAGATSAAPLAGAVAAARIIVKGVDAGFFRKHVLKAIHLSIPDRSLTSVIGPSGCGKFTLIRCIKRLHERASGAWARGPLFVEGNDVYAAGVNPVALRRQIGMVFQRPNPFPAFSVNGNVAAGPRLNGPCERSDLDGWSRAASAARRSGDEVKDGLAEPGTSPGGQQQRLCIARALAVEPKILLLDEPCSALDPVATERIEELIRALKRDLTLVLVTHNIRQAARVADRTAFLCEGELVEEGPTAAMFTRPADPRTETFLGGCFAAGWRKRRPDETFPSTTPGSVRDAWRWGGGRRNDPDGAPGARRARRGARGPGVRHGAAR